MTPLLDERVYVKAIRSLLDDASDEFNTYDYDDLPGGPQNATEAGRKANLPRLFALVSLERRTDGQLRAVAATTRSSWRLAVQCAGRTVDEARGVGFACASALNSRRLEMGGVTTTPLLLESQTAATWDDGRFVADYIYTFVH